jgi:small-conductance mechanosensitive channel/CRP-like cAMP-binding protein
LFPFLAQTSPAASPPPPHHFQFHAWLPTPHELLLGGATAFGLLLAGLLLSIPLRHLLRRLRLRLAYAVLVFALAAYAGLGAYKPHLLRDSTDALTFWIHRVFAAALVFVGLTVIDRLILLPILSRGGRVPVQRFAHQMAVILLILFAAVIYGSYAFGWDIDKFLAGSAIVSIVLGLALQESLGNFFSGLVLQASPPFLPGHWIVCAGLEGRVVDMTWRAVTLHTDDDNHVIIPNATVAKEQIINLSSPTTVTSRDIRIGLDYDLPPHDAIATLRAAALETPGVLPDPAPVIYLLEFADSALVYRVEFWINQPARHLIIEQAVRVSVWYRLKQKGYNIPFPMRTVEHTSLSRKQQSHQQAALEGRAHAIGAIPLFSTLSDEQKRTLATGARDLLFAPGQELFHQNDPGECFYIIRHGTVDVLIHPDGGGTSEHKVATLGPGEFFGEMSALTGQPRTATVRAASSLTCIEIDKADLHTLFQADPAIMEQISRLIAQRDAERAAIAQGLTDVPPTAARADQQNLLQRMLHFFRLPAVQSA